VYWFNWGQRGTPIVCTRKGIVRNIEQYHVNDFTNLFKYEKDTTMHWQNIKRAITVYIKK
jgi:hypothetical protein